MKFLLLWMFFIGLFFSSSVVYPQQLIKEIDVSLDNSEPIGEYLHYYQEESGALTLNAAIEKFSAGAFSSSKSRALSFGIGASPVWLQFEVNNPQNINLLRRLSIETSWLDHIEVYFISKQGEVKKFHAGDAQNFSERIIKNRFFQFDYQFLPGKTTLFMRVQTDDPLVLPIYLNSVDATYTRQLVDSYSYGFLYGGIFILMAYNFMLFVSLGSVKYLLYSLYLMFFMLANFSYTGHAYRYLWPESTHWQIWSNPVLMILYAAFGLMFAIRFLNMRTYFPRLHRTVIAGCLLVAGLQLLAILTSNHTAALLIAFTFILLFAISMPLLGAVSLRSGNSSAKYFLIASVIHAFAAAITAMVVWGLIPYSALGYRAVDIGMMIDATLLAMALAYQFRTIINEKLQAEKLAQVDPLTQINNRRAFNYFVASLWSNSIRHKNSVSVIIIDIDFFKKINDTYGHAQGDEVLIEVANTLKSSVRSGDILARWGGEEFIVFLPDTTRSQAVILAQRFRKDVENIRVKTSAETIRATVSIGVADNEFNADSLDRMILEADNNLYQAKDAGRNRVVMTEL